MEAFLLYHENGVDQTDAAVVVLVGFVFGWFMDGREEVTSPLERERKYPPHNVCGGHRGSTSIVIMGFPARFRKG